VTILLCVKKKKKPESKALNDKGSMKIQIQSLVGAEYAKNT